MRLVKDLTTSERSFKEALHIGTVSLASQALNCTSLQIQYKSPPGELGKKGLVNFTASY